MRADVLKCWKIFHGKCGIAPSQIFHLVQDGVTRGHRYKIGHLYSSVECRRRFFSLRVASVWNSLPDEMVALECIGSFKAALHLFLGRRLFSYED